jgi:chromosome segregation ATPase
MGIIAMEEEQSPTFKISGNDEPEDIRQDELHDLKVEKLGHRVTLLTVLIPCMILVIGIIAYLDIKDRVTRSQDTGAIGVQKLSKDLASKFSSLSLEQAKINDIHAKKLPQLEKDAAFLRTKLANLQKSLTQMSQSMINRDELGRVVDNLVQKVNDAMPEGITTDVENLKSNLAALSEVDDQIVADGNQRQATIASLTNSLSEIKSDVDTIRQDMANIGDRAIDKGELELALKLKEIGYRQLLLDKTKQLEQEIQLLAKKLEKLKTDQKQSSGAAAPKPTTQQAVKPKPEQPASQNNAGAPSNDKPTNTEPGGIVEQTIE